MEYVRSYAEIHDWAYETAQLEADQAEARAAELIEWFGGDCRAVAEKIAESFYKEDLQANPETLAQKQECWEFNLTEEASYISHEVQEAMYCLIEQGWEDFIYYEYTITQAKKGGYFQGRPDITTEQDNMAA